MRHRRTAGPWANDVHIVTDVPSTYRVHLFRALSRALTERGVGFRVSFLSRHQRHRVWSEASGSYGFRHSFGWGPAVYPRDNLPVHINPGVWARTMVDPGTWLVLGGAWYQPAVLGSVYCAHPRHMLLWTENAERMTFSSSSPVERVRRNAYEHFGGFVVPGTRADDHARSLSGRRSVRLPNTVDESLFRDRVSAMRADRGAMRAVWNLGEEPVLLWPTRLVRAKGVVPFLEAIRGVTGEFTLLVAGDGVLADEVAACILRLGLGDRVRLIGKVSQEQMLELYTVSDALLLASLFDPYPLSTIEALWSGLPLLLSERVGSVPEVLDAGSNGWSFDPSRPERAAEALASLLEVGRSRLEAMGSRSREIACERFETEHVASRFAEDLLDSFPP